jgi:hypothetical protein
MGKPSERVEGLGENPLWLTLSKRTIGLGYGGFRRVVWGAADGGKTARNAE